MSYPRNRMTKVTKPLLRLPPKRAKTIARLPPQWQCYTPLNSILPFSHSPSQLPPRLLSSHLFKPFSSTAFSQSKKRFASSLAMDSSGVSSFPENPVGLDRVCEEEYTSQSRLLQEFTEIATIDKAWAFTSSSGYGSKGMFAISQPNLLANVRRRYILSSHISNKSSDSVSFEWAPFPVEMTGVFTIVPSPSGSKLLVVRNAENDSPTRFEIWGPAQVEKEFQVPRSIHGSVYADGWFEGISWNFDETLIAYVAEEPVPSKPTFTCFGYKKGDTTEKDMGNWKGQGEWEEDWGETYAGKRQPALFVINIISGEVQAVEGVGRFLSVGQVVWAPAAENSNQYLVFVGWPSDARKLGIKHCYNRPCALYAVTAPFSKSQATNSGDNASKDVAVIALTQSISSAFFPRFSPDGKYLVFLSARTAVDSGAHWATNSLHRIDWPADGKPGQSGKIVEVVPVVMCPDDGCFPGLYLSKIPSKPWLSDGFTLILSSIWGSTEAILSVNALSGQVSQISPSNSNSAWGLLALDGDSIIAVSSSPVDIPQIKYGVLAGKASEDAKWSWLDVTSPISRCSEKVRSFLSSRQFDILKIPVRDIAENLTKGASKPYEAIFVSSKSQKNDMRDPLIVVLHGGPHSVSLSGFSKSLAFLSSLGYSLLIVNYRGSLGFGEEALQSLPGKVGSQDVNDVLAAIDHVIDMGLADPSKIAVMGGSHGGFLTTHLIGQAPDKFAAACARNPACNLSLMVGTTDIPDWVYVESFGSEGKSIFTEVASPENLTAFYNKSPVSHISKVETPTLLLLGAKDLRVPVSSGIQYARALKERGREVKVIVFPEDTHGLERPQSDFESYLNIGVWFKKYCS
ncbi:acylamino-acid-releasing enzyme-like isoform X1 [Coffea arabica]|uniref:acylaminoacyl-peptidase n=2 Tax=Coffea arabica TaxID=13443 RepID=A0ABM4X8Z2_COFAR